MLEQMPIGEPQGDRIQNGENLQRRPEPKIYDRYEARRKRQGKEADMAAKAEDVIRAAKIRRDAELEKHGLGVPAGKAFERVMGPEISRPVFDWENDGYCEAYLSLVSNSVPESDRNYALANDVLFEWAKKNIDFVQAMRIPYHEAERKVSESRIREYWKSIGKDGREELLLGWAMKHQPESWKPEGPDYVPLLNDKGESVAKSEISKNLFVEVSAALESVSQGGGRAGEMRAFDFDSKKLRLYVGFGSPADTVCHADMFFEYEGAIVKIDTTLNSKKARRERDERAGGQDFGQKDRFMLTFVGEVDGEPCWDIKGTKDKKMLERKNDMAYEEISHVAPQIAERLAIEIIRKSGERGEKERKDREQSIDNAVA